MSLALIARPPAGATLAARSAFSSERLLVAEAADRAVEARVRRGRDCVGSQATFVVHGRTRPCRPGAADALRMNCFPGLTRDFLDQLAGDHVEHVVVGIAAAEAGRRLDVAQPAHRLLARMRSLRGTNSRSPAPRPRPLRWTSRSRTVISRVTQGSYIRNSGMWSMTLSSQSSLPCVDQDRERGDGERLAGRAGREDGVGVDRLRRAEVAHAEAARQRRLAVLDDGDRDAGRAERSAQRLDPLRRSRRAEPASAARSATGEGKLRQRSTSCGLH